jgi:hypothetical protein
MVQYSQRTLLKLSVAVQYIALLNVSNKKHGSFLYKKNRDHFFDQPFSCRQRINRILPVAALLITAA